MTISVSKALDLRFEKRIASQISPKYCSPSRNRTTPFFFTGSRFHSVPVPLHERVHMVHSSFPGAPNRRRSASMQCTGVNNQPWSLFSSRSNSRHPFQGMLSLKSMALCGSLPRCEWRHLIWLGGYFGGGGSVVIGGASFSVFLPTSDSSSGESNSSTSSIASFSSFSLSFFSFLPLFFFLSGPGSSKGFNGGKSLDWLCNV